MPAANRTPVKPPGPRPNAMPSSCRSVTPAWSSSAAIMGSSSSLWLRSRIASRALTAPSSHSATEQRSVALSSASSFTTELAQSLQCHVTGMRGGHRRQAGAKHAAVAALADARIADHHHAAILFAANQSPHSLLERQYCLGQLVVAECIGALCGQILDAGTHHRILRRGEWQLVDDHQS